MGYNGLTHFYVIKKVSTLEKRSRVGLKEDVPILDFIRDALYKINGK